MKSTKIILIIIINIFCFSCSQGDINITDPDYSILGLSTITINNVEHSVSSDMLINDDSKSIVVNSVQYNKVTKHTTIEYVINTSEKNINVSAESNFSDVSIIISKDSTQNGQEYKVIDITRQNYVEHVTYKFFMFNISI